MNLYIDAPSSTNTRIHSSRMKKVLFLMRTKVYLDVARELDQIEQLGKQEIGSSFQGRELDAENSEQRSTINYAVYTVQQEEAKIFVA